MRKPWTGATKRFPKGMLDADDEGELQFAVGDRDGVVVLDFGKPIAWLGLPPVNARALAALLVKRADHIDRGDDKEEA